MSMGPWVSYWAGTWRIDECENAFCLMLRNLDLPFLSLFSLSFVLPLTICLVSWIPRIPVLWTPAVRSNNVVFFENPDISCCDGQLVELNFQINLSTIGKPTRGRGDQENYGILPVYGAFLYYSPFFAYRKVQFGYKRGDQKIVLWWQKLKERLGPHPCRIPGTKNKFFKSTFWTVHFLGEPEK